MEVGVRGGFMEPCSAISEMAAGDSIALGFGEAESGALSSGLLEEFWTLVDVASTSSPVSGPPAASSGGELGVCGASEHKEAEVVDREGEGEGWGSTL